MKSVTIDPRFCRKSYLAEEHNGISALLAVMTLDCEGTEEELMALFILATSPDRLDNPRRGQELWDYLRETFPGNRGIDIQKLALAASHVNATVTLQK